jgi:hypothetical protein
MTSFRTTMLASTAAGALYVTLVMAGSANAADLYKAVPAVAPAPVLPSSQAVDGINGAFKLFGGGADTRYANDGGFFGATGILAVPLGPNFGTQIEGTVIGQHGDAYLSLADHLFWRDPQKGLVGLYGAVSHYNGLDGTTAWRAGAEAEAYYGRITLRGIAGAEHGNKGTVDDGTFISSFDLKTRFFDMVDVVYYPTDNWNVFAGHRYVGGKNALALGTEYLAWSNGGMAVGLFAEGRIGEDKYKALWGGVKIHFGTKEKSLIRRDREDDPNTWEPDSLFGISNSIGRTPTCEVFNCEPT